MILFPFIVGTMRISLGIESSPCSNQWQTISTNDGWCIRQQLHILHLCISNRQKDAELARHQPPTLIDQYFLLIEVSILWLIYLVLLLDLSPLIYLHHHCSNVRPDRFPDSAGQSDSDEEELENFNLVCQARTPPGWFVVKTPGRVRFCCLLCAVKKKGQLSMG